eukprot:1707656-Prorocentrum_lima.AAC.1
MKLIFHKEALPYMLLYNLLCKKKMNNSKETMDFMVPQGKDYKFHHMAGICSCSLKTKNKRNTLTSTGKNT